MSTHKLEVIGLILGQGMLRLGDITLLFSQSSNHISRTAFLLHNLLLLEMATHSASGPTLNSIGLCYTSLSVDVEKQLLDSTV